MSGTTIAEDGRLRFDGLETRLDGALLSGQSEIHFTTPLIHSGNVPVQSIPTSTGATSEYIPLAILDEDNRLSEIVHLYSYFENTVQGVVRRGQEGTPEADHDGNAKVVHAATVQDYLNVQDHAHDPDAHHAVIDSKAKEVMQAHLTAHEQDPTSDPHPVYVRRDSGVMDTVLVRDSLVIQPNAQLIIEGNLVVEGRLIINGYELHIGPNKPQQMPDNLIWIQPVT